MAFRLKICLLFRVGNKCKSIVSASGLSEYERVRRDFVRLEFTDSELKQRFGLSQRYADFAREFAISGNAKAAAMVSGFALKTAEKNAVRIKKKCSHAIEAIRAALIEKGDSYKIALREHLTASLLDIIDRRAENPAPAVMAAKMLFEMYRLDVPPVERVARDDVSVSEIEGALKSMNRMFGPLDNAMEKV